MYIAKCQLTDFRSYKAATFEFGKINLIRGLNATGKSTLADAIEFALTGRCRGTDEAGKGSASLIRNGARQAEVSLELAGKPSQQAPNARLTRILKDSGTTVTLTATGRTYTGRQVEEALEKLGYAKDVLTAALRIGRFAQLGKNEQKELLADLLKPEAVKVPEEFVDWTELTEITLDDVRRLEGQAARQRAECTAALRELGEPEPVPEPQKGQPDIATVRKKIDGLRAEQNSIRRERDKKQDDWATKSEKRRTLPVAIKELEARILDKKEEAIYLEALDHEKERNAARTKLYEVEAQIRETEVLLEGAKHQEGKCPTCGQEADTESIVARFGDALSALRSRVPALAAMVNKYDVATARERLSAHRFAVSDADRLKKELDALGPKATPPDTKDLDKQIDDLEARIQKGQEVLGNLAAYEEKRAAYLRAVEKKSELERRREQADKIAKWAGPSGIQAQMTGGKLPAFTEATNKILRRVGYDCAIDMEPYSIRVKAVSSPASYIELALLSESEQWRFSLAFQSALSQVSGLSLAIYDRADVLAGQLRGEALRAAVEADLDQIFILASAADRPKLPPNFTVFDLTLSEARETQVEKEK